MFSSDRNKQRHHTRAPRSLTSVSALQLTCCPHGAEVNEAGNGPQADTLYRLILLWDIKNFRARLGNLGTWVEKRGSWVQGGPAHTVKSSLKGFFLKDYGVPIKDMIIIEGSRKKAGRMSS